MEPAEAVLRFLAGVGPGSEAEFYLRLFRSRARESFAAIVVDPQTMQENADGVALDLRMLGALSLTPVVVLGFDEPTRADEHGERLREKLAAMGVSSESLSEDSPRERIAHAAARGAVPLVTLRGQDAEARLGALASMLNALQTHKLIFLRNEGGIRVDGKPVSVVNLSDEFAGLVALPDLSDGQRSLLGWSRRLVLELLHHELLVTITSPLSLVHELFTVKGAGTLLRRGARIERHAGLAGVDRERLRALLTSSFDRPPHEQLFARPFTQVYVETDYRGAALVTQLSLGPYMSKFAVTREAQGEGIGRDLWQAMMADHRALFWRARVHNPIRPWYEAQCDGRARAGEWIVYWKGLAPAQIPDAVELALAQPIDL